jgi:hypothetical protein
MNLAELQRKLLAAGRAQTPSDAVPYAFEQRVLARIGQTPAVDAWAEWARGLWRAVTPCVAVALLLGVWSLVAPAVREPAPADLAQAFEEALLAGITLESDSTW